RPPGCTNTVVFSQVTPMGDQDMLYAAGAQSFRLAGLLPLPPATYSDVTTYNLVAGLEGAIPGMDWTWEAFVNHGMSRTLSRQTGMYSLGRMRAVFTAPNFGQNFSYRSNASSGLGLGGTQAGFGATTGTCTTGLNFFHGYQGVSRDCFAAISADVSNSRTGLGTIGEVNVQ